MAQIIVNATDEQIKAVEAVVMNAQEWLQSAWEGKANNCIKRVIENESNFNPNKMNENERKKWIKNNTFKTRVQKENAH